MILRFVKLEESHLPAVLEIEKTANSAPWSENSFRNELDHAYGIFLVALGDGKVVGYGGIWLVVDEAHVINLAVAPEFRRQGIARRLMIELLELAKKRGMTCSTLEVRVGNEAALELYETLGYAKIATRHRYYPDNNEDAIVMWLYELDSWTPKRVGSATAVAQD